MKRKEILKLVQERKITSVQAQKMLLEVLNGSAEADEHELLINLHLTDEWVQSNLEPLGNHNNTYLVYTNDRAFYDDIARRAVVKEEQAVLVVEGKQFQKVNDTEYVVNAQELNSFISLYQCLNEQNIYPNKIVKMCEAGNKSNPFTEQMNDMFVSLLYLLKATMRETKQAVQLVYAYENEETIEGILNDSLEGVSRTVKVENGRMDVKAVSLTDRSHKTEIVWDELNGQKETTCVKYENGVRYVKELKEAEKIKFSQRASILKEQGVYIIAGGAGKLGFMLADYIGKRYHAKIVLTGRREQNSQIREKMEEIEQHGAQVSYVRADIEKLSEVKNLIKTVKDRYGKINGIIHAGGVIRDSLIQDKTVEETKKVLSPKILGAVNLDLATKEEPIDLMLYYSSISGVLGNMGQVDYAFANAFLDQYCSYRNGLVKENKRFGKTVSINWPYWKEGGMSLDADTIKGIEMTYGIKPMPTSIGLELLEYALGNETSEEQIINIYGTETLRDVLFSKPKVKKQSKMDKSVLLEKTKDFFKHIFAELLCMSFDEIDEEELFQAYGVDSFLVKEFNTMVEKKFMRLSKTILFEYQTIQSLSEFVLDEYPDELIALFEIDTKEEKKQEIQKENHEKILAEYHGNQKADKDDIAIIGVDLRVPKANSMEELWQVLANGVDGICKIPSDRWDDSKFYDSDNRNPKQGKYYCQWGGFIDKIDEFDPLFFGISPREAELTDPQERLLIESAWKVIEDAGYTNKELSKMCSDNGENVGVFVGSTTKTYDFIGIDEWNKENYVMPNALSWSLSNRLSYLFNFNGPSMQVDTACSSSLTALHLACRSLQEGECATALVGGVNLYLHPQKYVMLSQMRMLSSTGKCHSFGAEADGFVPGEGVVTMLLKPLKKAQQDKDHIYAVIKASAVNHGGTTNGYTVPNPEEQRRVIVNALENGNIKADEISYIEAHGTGTLLGDPIEITGLTKAFRKYTDKSAYCSIGSIKSNFGHLEGAAGLAGIAKIILQMQHRMLVPSLYTEKLNENIDFEKTPFYVQKEMEEWKSTYVETEDGQKKEVLHKAGISAFGAGGANAHVILEEYRECQQENLIGNGLGNLLVLSAKSENILKAYAKNLADYLENMDKKLQEKELLECICYTLQTGRVAMEVKTAFVCTSIKEAVEKLRRIADGGSFVELEQEQILSTEVKYDVLEEVETKSHYETEEVLQLAKMWMGNSKFSWKAYYFDQTPGKISLPTYPFDNESYWVPVAEQKKQVNSLHPMIDQNTSNFKIQSYTKKFTDADKYLRDHKVNQQMILPAVAYLEMARAAASCALEGESVAAIQDVVWVRSIEKGKSKEAVISLEPREDYIRFEIRENHAEDILYCQGNILYPSSEEKASKVYNIEEIKGKCNIAADKVNWYNNFKSYGFEYGKYMQSVEMVWSSKAEVLAKIQFPESSDDFGQFVLHPAIMDGAFQSVLGFENDEKSNSLYLPYKIDKLEILGDIQKQCYAYITYAGQDTQKGDILSMNIVIMDLEGKVLVKVDRYTAKKVMGKKEVSDEELLELFRKLQDGEESQETVLQLIGGLYE